MTLPFYSLRRAVALILGASLCALSTARAAPAAPADDPAPALLATINSVLDLAAEQTPETIEGRVPEIRAKMSEMFAIEAIVQRAFGRNWSKLTPAQQTEVIDLLGRLVIRTYAVQLTTGERPVITISASRLISPERREITSTATQQNKTVNVIYRLAPIDGGWKVYDVLAENISVVGNYRQQFDAHFQKKNADDLIKILREKLVAPVVVDETTKAPVIVEEVKK
jgi:phospholipid transport system substrate-binding protein